MQIFSPSAAILSIPYSRPTRAQRCALKAGRANEPSGYVLRLITHVLGTRFFPSLLIAISCYNTLKFSIYWQ